MIKNLRYLCTLLLIAVASAAWGETKSITFSELGLENGVQYTDPFTSGDVSVTFAGGANDGKYYNTGSGVRTYGNGTITITANNKTITNIVLTFSGAEYAPASGDVWTSDGTGTGTSGVNASWSGSATEVVLTRPSGSGHWRLQKVEVTYGNPTCAAPVFSPGEGTFTSAQNVSISCATSDATIYYTIDGSDPTTSSSVYSSPIAVSATTTIKAIAVKSGMDNSEVVTATYKIEIIEHAGTADDPFTVADARTFIETLNGETSADSYYATGIVSEIVEAYSSQFGNISYNISADGLTTSDQLQAYRGKSYNGANFTSEDDIQVGDVVVICGKLKKYNSTYEFDSNNQLVSLERADDVEAPTFSPSSGLYTSPQNVTITAEEGVAIYYTIDSSTPTTESTEYTEPISVSTSITIKAIAVKGDKTSAVTTAHYAIVSHVGTEADPYTVADARAAIDINDGVTDVCAKGIVAKVNKFEEGAITYWISADGSAEGDMLEAYKGKGMNGENFTELNDIQLGDIVVIRGNLKKYNSTYEFDADNYLVSFERPETPVVVPTPSFDPPAGEVEAGTMVKIIIPEEADGVKYSLDNMATWIDYNDESIEITRPITIYAYAYDEAGNPSKEVSASYTIKASVGDNPFVKVTSTEDLEDGAYLIVYEEGSLAFNGGLETLDAVGNSIEVTIDDNQIAATDANKEAVFFISKTGDDYSLLSASGKYIGQTTDANGLKQQETALANTITFGDNGVANIVSGSAYLRYNATSGQTRFRYFKSSSYTNQKPVYLYKLTGELSPKERLTLSFGETTAFNAVPNQAEFEEPTLSITNPAGNDVTDLTITYSSSDTEIAAVDVESGVVTIGAKEGTATITATFAGNEDYFSATASYTITVADTRPHIATKVSLTPTVVFTGAEGQFSVTVTAAEGVTEEDYTVSFSSGDNNKLVVSDGSYLVGEEVGNVTVTVHVTAADQTLYSDYEEEVSVTIKKSADAGEDRFELITNVSTLAANDVIVIANIENGEALSITQNSNNRAAATVYVDTDGSLLPDIDIQRITLEGDVKGWYFNVGDGYLYAASSSANHLKTEETADDNAKALISIDESGNATITFQGSNTRNMLRYNPNSGSPIFSCYASGQQDVQLFKKLASTEPLKGDVNDDKKVDIADVTALVNALKEGKEPTEGNIDGQNGVNAEDVRALVEMILSNSNQ
ncbi:MAG: chitobiase/beta-hexosaminidase C-terminal domain-containing protein [Prevotella sp.]|nr:chitobiase/beta-hexosaminidase C-terminal domain-containing protein [Prevotella sp.]